MEYVTVIMTKIGAVRDYNTNHNKRQTRISTTTENAGGKVG